jgi:biopolymer transport protein ExbD
MLVHSAVAEPQVNFTPLIDVMLVMLVILIITLPGATQVGQVNLPQGVSVPPPSVRVHIYSAGEMYWNDEHVDSIAQLMPRFEALAQMESPPSVSVVPDKRAPYERVAQVLAAAQKSRVHALSVTPIAD